MLLRRRTRVKRLSSWGRESRRGGDSSRVYSSLAAPRLRLRAQRRRAGRCSAQQLLVAKRPCLAGSGRFSAGIFGVAAPPEYTKAINELVTRRGTTDSS